MTIPTHSIDPATMHPGQQVWCWHCHTLTVARSINCGVHRADPRTGDGPDEYGLVTKCCETDVRDLSGSFPDVLTTADLEHIRAEWKASDRTVPICDFALEFDGEAHYQELGDWQLFFEASEVEADETQLLVEEEEMEVGR